MNIDNGIYDIDSIRDSYTNAFSYIITGDTSKEFKIIRGGPGGGGEDGFAYYDEEHTSPPPLIQNLQPLNTICSILKRLFLKTPR